MNIRAAKFVQNLRGLSSSEKAVALNMAVHASAEECKCTAGMTLLAAESGLKTRETASRIATKLETKYGIIKPIGSRSGGRISTTYTFTFSVNRDCGITDDESNRDSGVTVEGSKKGSTVTFGAPTVTWGTPTVTRESHEGFKVLRKVKKQPSPSAPASVHTGKPTAADKEQANAFVLQVKVVVAELTEGKARMYQSGFESMRRTATQLFAQGTDPASLMVAVRARVNETLNGDNADFNVQNVVSDLAGFLEVMLPVKNRASAKQKARAEENERLKADSERQRVESRAALEKETAARNAEKAAYATLPANKF
jgi:hypothetical protein